MTRLVAAAIAAVVLFTSPALAAAKPKIEKLEPDAVPAGRNVVLVGENIPDQGVEIVVTVSGEQVLILDNEGGGRLRISIPDTLRPGKHPVIVTVGGQTSNKVDVRVMDEKEAKELKDKDAVTEAGTSAQLEKVILLDAPRLEASGGQMAIPFSGQADLPDGATIALRLTLGTDTTDSKSVIVAGKRITGIFGPYTRPLLAGEYYLEAHFSYSEQTRKVKQAFKKMFPSSDEQAKRMIGKDRQPVRVGTVADVESQARELRDHYTSMIQKVRDGLRDLESGYASALRSSFKAKDGTIDEAAWEEWLVGRTLRGFTEVERTKRLREFKAKKDFLNAGGGFADAKWREWIDAKREEIGGHAKTHAQLRDKYFNLKEVDALKKLEVIFDDWQKLSRLRSRELYGRNNLPFSEKDPETQPVASHALADALDTLEKRVNPVEK